MPHSESVVFSFVVGPSEHGTAPIFEWQTQVLLIPRCERGAIAFAFQKDSTNSSNLRHHCSLLVASVWIDNPNHLVGPITKIVFPKGSMTSNVRAPHASFLGARRTSTRSRHSS